MTTPVRWGIIGLGKIAHKFAQDLRLTPETLLIAVASSSQDRSDAFGVQYGALFCYGSYAEMLACPELDIVYVATPHVDHCRLTLMCLNAKIPVLCEKPFAMNAREVGEMIRAARDNQVFLMEAMWTAFIPSFQEALNIIALGEIGKTHSLKADFGFCAPLDMQSRIYNKSLGGGSLLDVGIYPIFLALKLFGKPQEIQATAKMASTGVDETCAMIFSYTGGEIAMLHSSIVAKTDTTAHIYGEKGCIFMPTPFHHPDFIARQFYYGETEEFHLPIEGKGYHFEAAEAGNCLRRGALESEVMSHALSLDLIETLDRVREKIGLSYNK